MKTPKLPDEEITIFISDDLDTYQEAGAFDDNWIISACDLFGLMDASDNPFDREFIVRTAA